MSFDTLGLHPDLLKGIRDLGFERPTPVQAEAIPQILSGRDVIASAQTGTGKTAAFVLPILHRFMTAPRKKQGIRALIVAPTRELALQSMEHLKNLSRYVPLKGHAIFGGTPMEPQISALKRGLDIVSATPGRLLDHVYSGRIDFGAIEVLVLDEADRMMDMGFLPDVQKIISLLPPHRQNLIFSATIPPPIMELARRICRNPVTVQIGPKSTAAAGIRHAVYPVSQHQKTELLLRLLNGQEGLSSAIVFTRTKIRADRLTQSLERAGIRVSVIHGDRSQTQRSRALESFKRGRAQVLVATDVAARGIDVKDISHVINFDVPSTPEDYIHRAGRTARADATGDAFSLVTPEEEEMIRDIERVLNQRLPRVILPDFNYQKGDHRPHKPPFRGGPHPHAPRHHRPSHPRSHPR
ncbi:MAG: DEAD/DEAH box helicase [Candidatus Omnitrophica bacterium]|nr:DEAD/DEAH box helicase [Candidatus Omnitrophota bacterium]